MKAFHRLIAGVLPAASMLGRPVAFRLLLLGGGLMLVQPCAAAPFQFEPTGSLAIARGAHSATLLPNGTVLVAGGRNNGGDAGTSAELYDPATGTWTPTGSLIHGHSAGTATLLRSGKMLVAGGYTGNLPRANAELYDPVSGTWTATGSLATGRAYHTATLLPDGKVLVVPVGVQVPSRGLAPRLVRHQLYFQHDHRFPFRTGAADRVYQRYSKPGEISNSHTTLRDA